MQGVGRTSICLDKGAVEASSDDTLGTEQGVFEAVRHGPPGRCSYVAQVFDAIDLSLRTSPTFVDNSHSVPVSAYRRIRSSRPSCSVRHDTGAGEDNSSTRQSLSPYVRQIVLGKSSCHSYIQLSLRGISSILYLGTVPLCFTTSYTLHLELSCFKFHLLLCSLPCLGLHWRRQQDGLRFRGSVWLGGSQV